MNRRNMILIVAGIVFVAIVASFIVRLNSGPPADRVVLAGDVRVNSRTVVAPSITYPTISMSISAPIKPVSGHVQLTQSVSGRVGPLASTASTQAGGPPTTRAGSIVAAGTLTDVGAQVGSRVTTGQVLAQLDTSILDLGVQQARINAEASKARVNVMRNNLDTVYDNIDKIATGRTQLATARTQLATGKAQLKKAKDQLIAAQKQLLKLKKQRPQLEAQLKALEQQAASFPPGQVPPSILAGIGKLKGVLAAIDPGLAKIAAGLKKVNAGQQQLATAEAKLATASSQLNTASDALATAKVQVRSLRDQFTGVSDAAKVNVKAAELRRDAATITSPCSGLVTFAVTKNSVAMVSAPLFRIQPDEPTLIDTYVTPDQLERIKVGSAADVSYDSAPGKVLTGQVAIIGDSALYPPTSFPTEIVHMTRTVKVTVRLDSGEVPPQGTPVDISIHAN